MPQNAFFLRTRDLLVSQKTTQRLFFPTLHPLSTVIFATATVLAFVLLRNSRLTSIVIHSVKQRLSRKITKRIHSSKPTSLNRPIEVLCIIINKSKGHIEKGQALHHGNRSWPSNWFLFYVRLAVFCSIFRLGFLVWLVCGLRHERSLNVCWFMTVYTFILGWPCRINMTLINLFYDYE